jgi:hypothetical protein
MIERLEQLTMEQFIDMVSGNTDVLRDRFEIMAPAPDKLARAMRDIVMEYKEIADPTGAHEYLAKSENLAKAKIELSVYSMCDNLVSIGQHDRAREVLNECGINASPMDEQRLIAEIKSRIGRAKRTIHELEKEDETGEAPEDIRRSFDEQTAAMMSHYKFQIDVTTIKATIYAHLVARFNREVKAQIAAMKAN